MTTNLEETGPRLDSHDFAIASEILDMLGWDRRRWIHATQNAVRDEPEDLFLRLAALKFDFDELDRRLGYQAFPDLFSPAE